jgi:hypothetical protein
MSETMRIALVAEGITDYEVLSAAVESMLGDRSFDLKLLQPEESVAFSGGGDAGPLGGGWRGVYRWCLQLVGRSGGKLSDDPLFTAYDLLLLHLDADVASEDPTKGKYPIPALAGVLPCAKPCPPSNATTDRLRRVMLSWIGEAAPPPQTVFCTPSKNMEAWVMAVFFPRDKEMVKMGWECHPKPEARLAQQPKDQRFAKRREDYASRKTEFSDRWPTIAGRLTEARRFREDFMSAVRQLP